MQTVDIQAGAAIVWGRQFLQSAMRLFSLRGKARESYLDQRVEERWDADYKNKFRINFVEIFANRLSTYAMNGSTVSCDDEELDELLYSVWGRASKWLPLALGVGRVYLVPYIIGDRVYTDFVSQSNVIATDFEGDDLVGFVCVSDIKTVGDKRYARLTHHQYDADAKTYTVVNKAVLHRNGNFGGDVPLQVVAEWADLLPEITFTGVEERPFGFVDSPKDNRNADKLQGASICDGCQDTIKEIYDTIEEYRVEFAHKRSVLGVDRSMIDSEAMRRNGGRVAIAQEHILTENTGKLGTGTDLFSVYSPDIRDAAYRDRLLHLFGRLEKQVGTSNGILTPADTSMATATQVKRSMYDTWAMVGRMRDSIESAMHHLAYGMRVMLAVCGVSVAEGYALTFDWSQDLLKDSTEEFAQISQGHSAKVLSDVEYRRFFYPNESPKEAQAALEEIRKSQPDPYDELFSVEPFGREDEGGGNE